MKHPVGSASSTRQGLVFSRVKLRTYLCVCFLILGVFVEASACLPPGFSLRFGGPGVYPGRLGGPHGLVRSDNGEIFVTENLANRVSVFDAAGGYLRSFGRYGTNPGQLWAPTDVAIGPGGYVYVVEQTGERVSVFSREGAFLWFWGRSGSGPGEFSSPMSIEADVRGNVFVVDSGNQRVQKFLPDGTFALSWGEFGTGPGQFWNPGGIAVDHQGRVFVCDALNSRIQVFTSDGSFLEEWPLPADVPGGTFPWAIALGENYGTVRVTDINGNRILELDAHGAVQCIWGEYGNGNGYFIEPYGITVDGGGNVFVSDHHNGYVDRFDAKLSPPLPPPQGPAKILFHVAEVRDSHCRPISSCGEASVTGDSGGPAYLYLLVARGGLSSVGAFQCGLGFENGKVKIHSWTLCADSEFPTAVNGSPEGAPWPLPGSGNLITWHIGLNCQVDDIAVAGYFYLSTYGEALIALTPRPVDGVAAVADCIPEEHLLGRGDLGYVTFSNGAGRTGCNPCLESCNPSVSVRVTTWGGIKALVH